MKHHHFLLLTYPEQGHINPTLELAKRLTRAGGRVTFTTTVHGLRRITTTLPTLEGLTYASFSDGYDDGNQPTDDPDRAVADLRRVGSETLTNLLNTLSAEGRPVTFLIYTILLSWAAGVARDMHVPSAFLCIQSATTFVIYHRYFNSHDGLYHNHGNGSNVNPSISINLVPGLPLFSCNDVPTFLLPSSPYAFAAPSFQEHIQILEKDPNPCVIVNTFDALEEDSIKAIDGMKMVTVGPLIPSDTNSFGIHLFEQYSRDYLQWLDSKPECSVIYVSFGSMVVLQKRQMEELLQGLIKTCRPVLWVIRSTEYEGEVKAMIEDGLSEEDGLIVPWCSQLEVLSHRSIGCFLTHCGWNSTVESLITGVPVVACPHFSDQTTNAKLVDEVWGTGVRAVVNEQGVVEREEIKRCLDIVMASGDRGEEMRRNAMKWKGLAMEAVKEGGSSQNNLKHFLERLR